MPTSSHSSFDINSVQQMSRELELNFLEVLTPLRQSEIFSDWKDAHNRVAVVANLRDRC